MPKQMPMMNLEDSKRVEEIADQIDDLLEGERTDLAMTALVYLLIGQAGRVGLSKEDIHAAIDKAFDHPRNEVLEH